MECSVVTRWVVNMGNCSMCCNTLTIIFAAENFPDINRYSGITRMTRAPGCLFARNDSAGGGLFEWRAY